MKHIKWIVLALLALSVLASAQTSSNVSVFATGFNNPRGLKWGPDGNLYVAEAGSAGTASTVGQCQQVPAPIGPELGGWNARISKVTSAGNRSTLVDGLPSAVDALGDVLGVADVAFVDNQMYALMAGGGCSHGHPNFPNSVLKVNPNGTWSRIADLSAYIKLHPTAVTDPGDFEPDGTWYGFIADAGVLYAVEPNHGEVDTISTSGIVSRFIDLSATQGHVVPTAIARTAKGFVIGNLNTFPINPGSSARYTVNANGAVTAITKGLTTVVAMVFKGDDLYVLGLSAAPGFPSPNAGTVVRMRGTTITTVATGLTVPAGMTLGPDGNLYVSNFGALPAPATGAGQIVKITIP